MLDQVGGRDDLVMCSRWKGVVADTDLICSSNADRCQGMVVQCRRNDMFREYDVKFELAVGAPKLS